MPDIKTAKELLGLLNQEGDLTQHAATLAQFEVIYLDYLTDAERYELDTTYTLPKGGLKNHLVYTVASRLSQDELNAIVWQHLMDEARTKIIEDAPKQ